MQSLFLLRHAETTANADGVLQGRMDFPLSERGKAQAEALVPRLLGLKADLVLSSPARRVQATLGPALEQGLPEPRVVGELDEIDLGEASGLSFKRFMRDYGPFIDERAYLEGTYRFPGGESRRDLYQRAERAWHELRAVQAERVLVASHGGLLSQLLAVMLGLPNDGRIRFRFDNAALCRVAWHHGRPFVSRFNDREHLPEPLRSPVFAPRVIAENH